jgi:hypothetical protein
MADPSWIDSSTIGAIAAGDSALEAEVTNRPGPLLMVPKVRENVLVGNPLRDKKGPWETPLDVANACRAVIARCNIQLDTMGSEADRQEFLELQFKFKAPGKGTAVRAISAEDAQTLSQVAASAKARNVQQAEFIVTDNKLANAPDAKLWKNVNIVTPKGAPKPGGGGPQGPQGAGGTGSGLTSGTPGFNPAKANIALMGLLAVGTLLNWLSDIFTEDRIRKDISDTEDWIRTQQQADPHMGILVVVELSQDIPVEASGYWPAPNYQGIDLLYGATRTAAEFTLSKQWTGVNLDRTRRIVRTAWIPPLRPAPPKGGSDSAPDPWLKRLTLVENALTPPADYIEALHILNGSSMYDMLRVIDRLAKDDKTTYDWLWGQLYSHEAPKFLHTRLEPAFSAVSDVVGGTGDFDFYKGRVGSQFTSLPKFERDDIEEYFSQGMKGVQQDLRGRWLVTIGTWTWYYHFAENRPQAVGFSDMNTPGQISWKGSWKWAPGQLNISWESSSELWPLPLSPSGQTGTSYGQGGKVTSLWARKG